jgi:hypothetical protein
MGSDLHGLPDFLMRIFTFQFMEQTLLNTTSMAIPILWHARQGGGPAGRTYATQNRGAEQDDPTWYGVLVLGGWSFPDVSEAGLGRPAGRGTQHA